MTSDYDRIRAENILEYGEGTRHLSFLGRLYTDRTHFIFELLQNAEDARASRILFKLFDDRLEVTHDGRPFNELDVKGVCGVGEGTKAEDLTQIGKFGIGFKSVYAYTATPEIHSSDESFRIENYVRPYRVEPKIPENSRMTLFVFAFDTTEINAETACREIGTRLRNLNTRTLLFLRNINEIEYKLPDQTGGIYLRQETTRGTARQVAIIGQNNSKDESENWLIFERPVPVPDGNGQVRVEVGFQIKTVAEDKSENVTRVKDATLVVYFPTEKETRLGFLIQGPYRTTPSRDNVPKDSDWNRILVMETARLLSDVLPNLKAMGLLTVSFLEALPIRMDDFPKDGMFFPIVDSVREMLMNKDLLPADDGTFLSAETAKLARGAELRTLLNQEQLRLLFQSINILNWLTGEITQDRTPELRNYLLNELHIEEVTPESFARKITESFLESQTDNWFVKFYQYLSERNDLWKPPGGILRSKPILRLQAGEHIEPFGKDGLPNAYLTDALEATTDLPIVKVQITQYEEAYQFLKNLKIPDLDLVAEVIEHIIPQYSHSFPIVSLDEHKYHIEKIWQAYKTDSQEKKQRLKQALQATPFILTKNLDSDEITYRKPSEVYSPTEDLKMYFSENSTVWFVSSDYERFALDMFMELGVSDVVRVTKKSPDYRGHIIIRNRHSNHERGLDGFDPNIKVDGLAHAMASSSLEKSVFIWNDIAVANYPCIRGRIERSSRETYVNSVFVDRTSDEFGRLLIESSWLPAPDGSFQKPSDVCPDDLPQEFERNENLANMLEMKKNVDAKLAEQAGVSAEILEIARQLEQNPDVLDMVHKELAKKNEGTIFPTRTSANPERRQEGLAEQLVNAPEKQYEERNRSIRTSRWAIEPELWLTNHYTNDAGQMVCQICKEEMPFKKRNYKYYFEAVEALSREFFSREHEAQYLALCPVCAAMYKEFVKCDEIAMKNLSDALKSSDELKLPLKLGELKTSIRFVESHWLDMRAILQEKK